jgi:serine/threonine protein kinase
LDVGFLDGFLRLFSSSEKRVDVAKRFDLRRRTGQGSMSKVWYAYDRELNRTVAFKLLDRDKTMRFEETFRRRKLDKPTEGEICMQLRHDNIVRTFEHGMTTTDEPYIVMEWIEGSGLNSLIDTRHKSLNGKRISILVAMADALAYLHSRQFIHRDICPRNVMLTTDGVVKLIDFGLTIPDKPEFRAPGNRTGTADYLAPEIINRKATDLRVDVYAMGITAFELLTGTLPWERATNSADTLRKHLNTPPRHIQEVRPDIDDETAAVVMRAFEKDPMDRYRSMAELRDAFEALSDRDY